MRIVRGRAATPDADRDATRALLDDVSETGVPAVRAWTPYRQMAFGRRDAGRDGYADAREAAESRGFPPVERSVGGRAVAYTGTTLAFAFLTPIEDSRRGIGERYDEAVSRVVDALESVGVDASPGEPPESFCPGDHSVQADRVAGPHADGDPGKVAGIAQRVTKGAALVAGVVVVADSEEIRDVLAPVYGALDVPFDPGSVGSVADAGGPADPDPVARALETAFVGDRDATVVALEDVLDADD